MFISEFNTPGDIELNWKYRSTKSLKRLQRFDTQHLPQFFHVFCLLKLVIFFVQILQVPTAAISGEQHQSDEENETIETSDIEMNDE